MAPKATRATAPLPTEEGSNSTVGAPLNDPDDPQANNPNSADESLKERMTRATAERDLLLRRRELRKTLEEVERLQKEEARKDNDDLYNDSIADTASTASHKRTASKTLVDPDKYSGSSLREHRDFIRECEISFSLTPENFTNDAEKVLWSMQFLRGDPREAWWSHIERISGARESTWDEFTQFLLDQLSDPINREFDVASLHAKAMQRKGQTTRAFATYLDTIESHLEPYSEHHRVQHLYSKLRPELQVAITNHNFVPHTREDLIAIGSTIERNLEKSAALPALRMRDTVKKEVDKREDIKQDSSHRRERNRDRPASTATRRVTTRMSARRRRGRTLTASQSRPDVSRREKRTPYAQLGV